ncbi:MAG: hypothetical protein D6690_09265 [Nitrospirae bacterium]|nr:MAG: hypothetical protein D6690_09265 [Nitrospirota bacterium]
MRSPDIQIVACRDRNECAGYLDTSGEPLFKRGWSEVSGAGLHVKHSFEALQSRRLLKRLDQQLALKCIRNDRRHRAREITADNLGAARLNRFVSLCRKHMATLTAHAPKGSWLPARAIVVA